MEKWEELFPQNTRKKGRELLENGRIRELSVNEKIQRGGPGPGAV